MDAKTNIAKPFSGYFKGRVPYRANSSFHAAFFNYKNYLFYHNYKLINDMEGNGIQSEGYLLKGKPEGIWFFYNDNYQKIVESTFSKGKLDGRTTVYDTLGKIYQIIDFK